MLSKYKPKHLTNSPTFSKGYLLAFALTFAGIGGFIIHNSFAAAPVIASVQAEQLLRSGSAAVISDTSASAGQAVKLSGAATLSGSVSLPSPASSLSIVARGSSCLGSWPSVNVYLDNVRLLTSRLTATTWTTYSAATAAAAGSHSVKLTYSSSSYYCRPAAYVDFVNVYGQAAPTTPAPTISFSASPTSVTAGQAATLTWNSTNATSCSASGAWSGSQPTSGSASTGALNQASTYTLTCTGTGGNANASGPSRQFSGIRAGTQEPVIPL
jgi:hypothetical protein